MHACRSTLEDPTFKAGNRPLPLLLLELAALGFLLAIVAAHRVPIAVPRPVAVALGVLVVYPLIQLVPLPEFVWRSLPGHGEYASVLDRYAGEAGAHAWRAISVIPSATEYGWLALLPPLACFFSVLCLSPAHVARLMLLLAILAGAEGVLGLLQVGPGGGGMLYFGNEEPGQYVAIGTFVNRNHLAALLAMALPVIIGLIVYSMRPGRHNLHHNVRTPTSEATAKRALLFGTGVLVLVCLFFTRSRAGIATGLAGLVCAAVVLVRGAAARADPSRLRTANLIAVGLIVISAAIALAIGIGPILRGLAPEALHSSADFRWAIYAATWHGALQFLPFGSGLSTYAGVFPRFQLTDAGGYIDYAHNDYLQAFMELGFVAPVIIVLLLMAWANRCRELLRDEAARSFTLLQLAAALAMVPMVLHSFFDFALHMPANAMWFAALGGVMFHRGIERETAVESTHAHRLTATWR